MHEPYALQVLGDEMAPEFPDRCIVIIEPTNQFGNGCYVFAEVEGVRWFRKYIKDTGGRERLVAENRVYPDIELDGLDGGSSELSSSAMFAARSSTTTTPGSLPPLP